MNVVAMVREGDYAHASRAAHTWTTGLPSTEDCGLRYLGGKCFRWLDVDVQAAPNQMYGLP